MLTPIRVRGKRKASKDAPSERERPRRFRKHQNDHQPIKYSPQLPLLPVEILQDIFCYGANLQLPLVCSSLYHSLTSHSVKQRLVFRLFSVKDSTDPSPCADIQQNRIPTRDDAEHDLMWLKHCVQRDDAIAKLQSAVIRQHWFTYQFLRECQKQHLSRAAHSEVRSFLCNVPKTVVDDQLRLIDDGLSSNLEWGSYSSQFVHPMKARKIEWDHMQMRKDPPPFIPFFSFRREDGEAIKVFLPDAFGLNSQLGVIRDGPAVAVEHAVRYTFPALQPKCRIPSKLQHGPWTQQKGYLLTQLIYGISTAGGRPQLMSPASEDYDAAGDALFDGLREQCVPWLRFYLAHAGHRKHQGLPEVLYMAEAGFDELMMPTNWDSFNYSTAPPSPLLRLDATGPWRAINEPGLEFLPHCWYDEACKKHFEVILHEAPINSLSVGLFLFLALETVWSWSKEMRREVGLVVLRASIYVEEPARLEMIHLIQRSLDG